MAKEKKFITCDGNAAAAHIAYMFSEVSCIYPITPSSPMAEYVDEWAAKGRKNMFGETVRLVEMQSEAGAAGAVHGSLQAGALTTTYTASQGLLLMIPNMYKIAGELLPCVFHVSARALAAHALSIFGDHADVYAARQAGFAMLASGSVQEVMDLSAVSHLTAIKSRVPFLNFFDGFRTSHEIQKIEEIDMEDLRGLVDMKALQEFRDRAQSSENPVTKGTAQNPDIYFQAREAANRFYDAVPDIVAEYMKEMSKLTGRTYRPFDYYGANDAENIIIAMGSVTETIREVIDYKMAQGEKVGMIAVHLYRPFSAKYFMDVMPASVRRIAVLDRTKEPGANGDPLYLDVKEIFYGKENAPVIVGGRYGLGSKDVTPAQIIAVYKNLAMNEPKDKFTIGIVDDVTFHSLPVEPEVKVTSAGTYEAKFYGLGSDGTVGANKNSIKIIGSATNKYCQAYFAYDSKKSGGFTASHLRFGDEPIRSTYLVTTPDFVACHVPAYVHMYDVLKGLKKGGSFLLNSIWDEKEVGNHLPNAMKRYLAQNEINFYIINGTKLGQQLGLGNRTNTIMQAAFFKITNVIPYELAVSEMKKAIDKSYGKKGEAVVKMNYAAVDAGGEHVVKVEIPADWKNLQDEVVAPDPNRPEFIRKVVDVMNAQAGDDLPVSAFTGREDGTFPAGTSRYEKRGIAINVPEWQVNNCIQCNQCAYVCPHAAIRPFLMTEAELAAAPAGTTSKPAIGKEFAGLQFKIQVSPLDCTGCGNCADVCPAKEKALVMKPLESQEAEIARFKYMDEKVGYKRLVEPNNVKNSQFQQPLFEFSGACAGCGETPYIKLITQLFGERMMVANATGCSSIYGGSAPSTPYCKNNVTGRGPAWANSLFEDNAEYGFGMAEGANRLRERVKRLVEEHMNQFSAEAQAAAQEWITAYEDGDKTLATSDKLSAAMSKETSAVAKEIMALKPYFTKKSQWIFGGDGWAYDIGYGGLDHVLASGQNVNVLVVDTEVYSNTGGQSSKSTPVGAVAKFAASGKRIRKKDLGMMAASYGYVYVAQVAMGANQAQYLKALKEAEAYPGPSLIIAYAPCINHGLKASMGKSQAEEKKAVECGYWQLYRYNPMLEEEGKNPFQLDSKEPDYSKFREFLMGEVRYNSLIKAAPEDAERLFEMTERDAKWRYEGYKRRAEMKYGNE
ncbi:MULTISPECIES: pyruvate:ferredoxin (flavodoxin) oxidoreductase [Sanguibacteroides]|uniref:Racemase n=1 Tax=Sanguibacteroides justesenii TaxID=1547597 RepID=A0A0C3RI62_9PORP|nr:MULTISPECIES: pyruvate:ferredoxin (flavodoxin) oxidoreductase [Sanguibacteroides]KIO46017.1 racemase [Sanguibacteroides justesenii]KIO47086.1 racemase [Sanguibacteroides justesenii]PXZ42723.1 pyruvate:ferredoxin (flavodoxin) oxidoreductase [Sanguibacteroides justesenii]